MRPIDLFRFRSLACVLVILALGCAGYGAPALAQAAALVFADTHQVSVDATTLDIRNADSSPTTYPYVTARSPVTYEQAARTWAAQRFKLTGNSVNTLRVTLRQGSIAEKLLPVSHGIGAWFKKEQGAEYTGALEVDVSIVDPTGQVLTTVSGRSWDTESVRQDATSTDRENAWLHVVKTTFDNLDNDIIPRMRETMSAYVH